MINYSCDTTTPNPEAAEAVVRNKRKVRNNEKMGMEKNVDELDPQ